MIEKLMNALGWYRWSRDAERKQRYAEHCESCRAGVAIVPIVPPFEGESYGHSRKGIGDEKGAYRCTANDERYRDDVRDGKRTRP